MYCKFIVNLGLTLLQWLFVPFFNGPRKMNTAPMVAEAPLREAHFRAVPLLKKHGPWPVPFLHCFLIFLSAGLPGTVILQNNISATSVVATVTTLPFGCQ